MITIASPASVYRWVREAKNGKRRYLDYVVSEFESYYNTKRSHMERDYLPPMRECESEEVLTLTIDQIEVKQYVGGLVKSFKRKLA